jgi:hypothetical protein
MGFLDDLRVKSGKTDLLEKEDLSPTDEGDHERFSHYPLKVNSQSKPIL